PASPPLSGLPSRPRGCCSRQGRNRTTRREGVVPGRSIQWPSFLRSDHLPHLSCDACRRRRSTKKFLFYTQNLIHCMARVFRLQEKNTFGGLRGGARRAPSRQGNGSRLRKTTRREPAPSLRPTGSDAFRALSACIGARRR